MSNSHYRSNVAFIDLLFNALIGFTFLFILAFLLIAPPIPETKKIDPKAELMVIMTWPDGDKSDVDLWIKPPIGSSVGFKNRESGLVHLERDDRGYANEEIMTPSGEKIKNHKNQEIIFIRGWIEGEWNVNVHAYHVQYHDMTNSEYVIPVEIELIQTEPYKILTRADVILKQRGEEKTAFNFIVKKIKDDSFKVDSINDIQTYFILTSSTMTNYEAAH